MRRTKQEMYPLVAAWYGSGASKSSYCVAHQLNVHTFTYWVDKYRKDQSAASQRQDAGHFMPLQVDRSQALAAVELIYPNGVRLQLGSQPSMEYLSDLVKLGSDV